MTSVFTLLSAVSAPGRKINEDAYGVWPNANAARAAALQEQYGVAPPGDAR